MKVTFQSIRKSYGNFTAVHDLNLTIDQGALHFLLGPSGCGKTTTLRMLAGLEKPSSGTILFGDQDVTHLPASLRGIGMVFQNYALWPHMTVRKNIEYGLKLRKLKSPDVEARLQHVLNMTQLTRFVDRLPGQLSGGQQQRVALARALAIEPSVLLLDEPLSNLDAKLRHEMRDNILSIHEKTGLTMVYVTHDQKEALSMATNISIMHSGHLMQTGNPREIYTHPKTSFVAGFIGETNILPGKIKEIRDGAIWVQTALGLWQAGLANNFQSWKTGDSVKVSVRPEAIRPAMTPKGGSANFEPGTNSFMADIKRMTYLGDSEQLLVQPKGAEALKVNIFHVGEHEHRPGDHITLQIDPADINLVPDSGEEIGPGT
jgi:ABC-type Fe3+/spermidine/putrescine transport system ATPase subunit